MLDYVQARRTMVDCQLRTFDVIDIALLSAMDRVPRENFVPRGREDLAYSDQPILVSEGIATPQPRTMLIPMVAARLIQALAIQPGSRALDVACGLGYTTAVLAELGARVVGLDTSEELVGEIRRRLAETANVLEVRAGPLADGVYERGPFDAILVNGLVERRPDALLEQLADRGRLACLQRTGGACQAVLYIRAGDACGSRPLFDAQAPVLTEFAKAETFVF